VEASLFLNRTNPPELEGFVSTECSPSLSTLFHVTTLWPSLEGGSHHAELQNQFL